MPKNLTKQCSFNITTLREYYNLDTNIYVQHKGIDHFPTLKRGLPREINKKIDFHIE